MRCRGRGRANKRRGEQRHHISVRMQTRKAKHPQKRGCLLLGGEVWRPGGCIASPEYRPRWIYHAPGAGGCRTGIGMRSGRCWRLTLFGLVFAFVHAHRNPTPPPGALFRTLPFHMLPQAPHISHATRSYSRHGFVRLAEFSWRAWFEFSSSLVF